MSIQSNTRLILRAAHKSEASEIAMISRQQIEYGLNWRWTPARVKRYIKDPETMVLVATIDGVLQGFAVMNLGEDTAHLLLLGVQPKSRRKGIGTAMLDWLEKSCLTAGIRQIRLEVRASNPPARQFYERRGFLLVDHLTAYYDRSEAALVMARRLCVQSNG